MMEYQVFKETITGLLPNHLPEEYRNMKLTVDSVEKINVTLDAVCFTGREVRHTPVIYVNDLYEEYRQTGNLRTVLENAGSKICCAMRELDEGLVKVDMENVKDKIVFQLINTEQNKEFLKGVPSRQFLDLSVIYRFVFQVNKNGVQSAVVTNEHMMGLGFSEEQLYQLAFDNTRRMFPPEVLSMGHVLGKLMPELVDHPPLTPEMWVISNRVNINGATSILYEDVLYQLSEQLKSDFYILPSSLHETIAIVPGTGDVRELSDMVTSINMTEVPMEDRLSNQVYRYDRENRRLYLATEMSEIGLDGTRLERAS